MSKKRTAESETPRMLDVPLTEATRQAERWAEINADIESKKRMLVDQTEHVIESMKKEKQRVLVITDAAGYKHSFAIVDAGEKLRHTKRQEV